MAESHKIVFPLSGTGAAWITHIDTLMVLSTEEHIPGQSINLCVAAVLGTLIAVGANLGRLKLKILIEKVNGGKKAPQAFFFPFSFQLPDRRSQHLHVDLRRLRQATSSCPAPAGPGSQDQNLPFLCTTTVRSVEESNIPAPIRPFCRRILWYMLHCREF